MSYQAVEWAIKRVPPGLVSVTARAVLVAFAEAADEHGREAYPSIPTVAWYLGCTERNVSGHVKSLKASGLLVKSADQSAVAHIPADRRPVVYQLPLHWVRTDEKPEAGRRGRKPIQADIGVNSSSGRLPDGAKEPSCREENGVKDSAKRGEETFLNGVKDSTFRGEETFREPSLESPVEPPSEPPKEAASASTSRKRSPSTRATHMTEDWKPKDDVDQKMRDEFPNFDHDGELASFRDYYIGHGKKMKDWDASWRNWVRRGSRKFASRSTSYSKPEPFNVRASATRMFSGASSSPEQDAPTIPYVIEGEIA